MKLQRTVIVPAYNAAGTLSECLAAVLSPDGQSQQTIVVDDGSTDGTAEIAVAAGALLVRQRRQGPAAARNAGARLSNADVLVFVDSDVVVRPGAIDRMVDALESDPELAAVFGSYDSTPHVHGAIATYRNLLHAYTHQRGASEATTFWAGLGAVRRRLFEDVGGFDSHKFETASIEDIEFGMRLKAAGRRIRLDREVLGTHCKQWTLSSMVRTDLWCRAVPWTRLLRRSGRMPNDLNLRWGQRVSVAAAWLVPPAIALIAIDLRWIGDSTLPARPPHGVECRLLHLGPPMRRSARRRGCNPPPVAVSLGCRPGVSYREPDEPARGGRHSG